MNHPRHLGSAGEAGSREAAQTRTLIADLDRLVRILDCDIAAEEARARVSDHSDAAYPILARTLAARRDNLRATIAMLEERSRASLRSEFILPVPSRLELRRHGISTSGAA